ncbi:lactate 2-monooxygenase [Allostreptomyces psammosilenae]|uniref:Isopentenyl diphosphate isomerase/L-lactate dehydrogenase-like FMN-dependent dehydrogenase n=1 Tax=Allostreptomyces psammosilenae TaxID=1892865 RepID=A0A852ZQ20_9ACTN|nr:lactate 2-monooxygenase [Allostreptomyces psammosilenae]NYI03360.1 isopentenyl diphosphate isomerase/L-lactate dehydrogenase-like FMN-dependent dehydrogenase [Allostreptomyces psammosilenae]
MSQAAAPRPANFSDHQSEIYLNGMLAGRTPAITTDLAGLEERAREVLPPEALGYVVPSAGSGATARANRAAFDRWRILPRMLRGAARRDLGCTVAGTDLPAPVLIAPMGVQTLAHPEGELATARAAAALGVPYVHSTQASHSFEQVAEAGGPAAPRWYQLYWPTDREVCLSFLRRARAAGYSALVVTLDVPLMGWRPADLDRGFLPFLDGVGIANYLTDPAFRAGLARPVEEDPGAAALHWAGMFPHPQLGWDDLPFLREHWDGPILLKGICAVEDAELAAEHGMDGVIVSNHGGRQVDGAVAALDALPAVADAVGDRLTVLFDSGVRTGADVVKALALGARAVLLGRPVLYGLALDGQRGVEHVLRCLLAELDLTVALTGHTSHRELDRRTLLPA